MTSVFLLLINLFCSYLHDISNHIRQLQYMPIFVLYGSGAVYICDDLKTELSLSLAFKLPRSSCQIKYFENLKCIEFDVIIHAHWRCNFLLVFLAVLNARGLYIFLFYKSVSSQVTNCSRRLTSTAVGNLASVYLRDTAVI